MAEPSYQEQVARLRQERAAREHAEKIQEIQTEWRSNLENRNEAARSNNAEDWHYWDKLVQENERDYQAFMPVQQPQLDPRIVRWGQRNQQYLNKLAERLGTRDSQFLNWIDAKLTTPRNPRDPRNGGMGLKRGSPAYFQRGRDLLELYSEGITGVKYDSNEQALTADEAARISGLSNRDYNRSVQTLYNQGRIYQEEK